MATRAPVDDCRRMKRAPPVEAVGAWHSLIDPELTTLHFLCSTSVKLSILSSPAHLPARRHL